MTECEECGAALSLDENKLEVGEIVSCPDCGVELEITGKNPLAVALAPMEEEDWGE
ncbi:MAG: lysine biosynthesis protein LysW [archaeon]